MAWWRYVGKVTKSVDLPGGPTVLVPNQDFESPLTRELAHLKRIKKIVPLKSFQIPEKEAPAKDESSNVEVEKSEPRKAPEKERVSDGEKHGVTSEKVAKTEVPRQDSEEEQQEQEQQEQEKEGKRKRKARRG